MSTLTEGAVAVLRRFLLCWACVAGISLFVFCSVALAIWISFDYASPVLSVEHAIYLLFLLSVVLAAINVPILWAIGGGVYAAFRRPFHGFARYVLALVIGVAGAVTLYYELRLELPTLARIGWVFEPLNQLIVAWNADLDPTAQLVRGEGFVYFLGIVSNLVCVTSAVAPIAATYIDERKLLSRPRGVQPEVVR